MVMRFRSDRSFSQVLAQESVGLASFASKIVLLLKITLCLLDQIPGALGTAPFDRLKLAPLHFVVVAKECLDLIQKVWTQVVKRSDVIMRMRMGGHGKEPIVPDPVLPFLALLRFDDAKHAHRQDAADDDQ